jgi:hypothetical protein
LGYGYYLYGLACDGGGNLYVATRDTIAKITPGGTVTTFASGLNDPFFIAIQSPPGAISGTVTNTASNPIQGATVSVVGFGTTYSATSAANGTYTITNAPVGTGYTVTAVDSGTAYGTGTVASVSVTASNTTTSVNFILKYSLASWLANNRLTGGELEDPANDGVSNLLKYAFNFPNPLVSNRSGLPVVGITTLGGSQYLAITYNAQPLAGDLTYSVQASTDMVNWTVITTPAAAAISPMTVMDSTTPLSAGVRHFLRVVVVGP